MSLGNETERKPVGRRTGLAPVLGLLILVLIAVAAAGCSTGEGSAGNGQSEGESGRASPAPRPETAQPAVSPTSTNPPPGLLPAREGFQPAPEQYAVMGDPNAPVTIVEYSDYQ